MSTEEVTDEDEPQYPLAYDANGNPIELPPEAVAWRVRRGGGRRGRPRHVFDPETGRQLEVPLAGNLDSLIDASCEADRYLLYPVDGEGRIIPGIIAVTEVPEVSGEEQDPMQALAGGEKGTLLVVIQQQLATIQRQGETLCRALEATTSGYGRVQPAPPAPVMVEQSPQQVIVEDEKEESAFKPEQIAEIANIAKSIFDMFKPPGGGAPPNGAPP